MISAISSRSIASRAAISGVLATAVAAIFVAGLAWACSPQAYVQALSASSGSAGSSLTVAGRAFIPNQAVRVSVGSQLVATAPTNADGDFTTTIAIPADTPAGTTTIVVVPTNSSQYSARVAFTVTEPSPSQPDPPGTPTPTPQSPDPAPAQQSGPAADRPRRRPARGRDARVWAGAEPALATARRTARPNAAAQQPAQPAGAAQNGRSAPQVAAGSALSPQTSSAADGRSGAATATGNSAALQRSFDSGPGAATPSRGSAASDVWSGFRSGERPSLSTSISPPSAGSPTELTLGMGILGIGLLTLLGGFAVADLRRRRARVDSR